MGSSRPLVLSRTFVLDDCNPRSFSSFSLSLSRSSLTGTDSGEVERSQGTRAPLIRHWPLSSALLISPCSLILNCDVFTGSREIYRPRGVFLARGTGPRADTLNLKETEPALRACVHVPVLLPLPDGISPLSLGRPPPLSPFSFLFLPFFLPPPPLPLTGGEKRERKRRR